MIFYFLFPLFIWSHNIIFVHLGKTAPKCLFTTMKQARYLNPECAIYLLSDCETLQTNDPEFFLKEQIAFIDTSLIPATEQHILFHAANRIDSLLADGLWLYALERFFTLFDFLRWRGLDAIVHLENDSMLYVDLDALMPFFQEHGIKLAAPFQSLAKCIPSFVFIKEAQSLQCFIDYALFQMQSYAGDEPHLFLNDMQLLASFYRRFGDAYITPLPTLMPEYGRYYPKKKSLSALDNGTPLYFLSSHASNFFPYIFDAAGLGIWINGNDRKYYPKSRPGTIHPYSLFDPSLFSFSWGYDPLERVVPFFSFKGKTYRIVNLHFHSKLPEAYTSFGSLRYDLYTRKNQ